MGKNLAIEIKIEFKPLGSMSPEYLLWVDWYAGHGEMYQRLDGPNRLNVYNDAGPNEYERIGDDQDQD